MTEAQLKSRDNATRGKGPSQMGQMGIKSRLYVYITHVFVVCM